MIFGVASWDVSFDDPFGLYQHRLRKLDAERLGGSQVEHRNRIAAPTVFSRRVKVDYGTVVWPGDIDVAPETLYDDSAPLDR